ncbi:winged helix-turn-helix transcriptional regulator [Thermus sp.]|uniref:LexA family protein n=1 Tax=Thermus sp. TaxID=275 RepID=UPI00391B934E
MKTPACYSLVEMPQVPLASLTRERQEILKALLGFLAREGRFPRGQELAQSMGLTPDSTWYRLRALTREGIVSRERGVYTLTERGLAVAKALGSTVWKDDEEVGTALRLLGYGSAPEDGR